MCTGGSTPGFAGSSLNCLVERSGAKNSERVQTVRTPVIPRTSCPLLNPLPTSGGRCVRNTSPFAPRSVLAEGTYLSGEKMAVKCILYFTAELGFLLRYAARLLTLVLTLGLSFVSLLRAFMQTLLCFRILDAVLHALRVGYSFSMFDTGLRGFSVTPTASLRGGCV